MAAAQLNASATASLPTFEGLGSSKRISNADFSLRFPSFTKKSFRGFVVTAATTISASKYTSVKPLGDRVLIKTKTVEEKSVGGILLPSSAQTKPQSGEVIAIGAGKKSGSISVPIGVKAGSEVIYSKYAGTEVEVDGSTHLIMKEDDVIGILETDDIKDLKPLNDRILVKVAVAEEKTAGGLLLTEATKERPSIGTVAAVGPGLLDEEGNRTPLPVSPGNTVLYSKYAGTDLKGSDGSDYIVLRVSDAMAILS